MGFGRSPHSAVPTSGPCTTSAPAYPPSTGETVEAFVPQMANLQLIDGVSFTKGCYTGQEVVARMQYLGKLKRRMYWAEVEADSTPTG
jgi:tRNA-modifying protein YgfZ